MLTEFHDVKTRQLSPLDHLISAAQTALETMASTPAGTGRPDPAKDVNAGELTDAQKCESARLMRVNHVGEVCAQALYEGQALTAQDGCVRDAMIQAAVGYNSQQAQVLFLIKAIQAQ